MQSQPESYALREHQEECVKAVLYAYLYQGRNQGIVEAPCSAGKTLCAIAIFSELIKRDSSTTALFILPSILLAHQTLREAKRFFPHHQIGLVQAENKQYNHKIVIATIDTLANPLTRKRLFAAQRFKRFSFLWIDECHLRLGENLEDILFDLEDDGALRLGTSATVWRSDNQSLAIPFPHGLFHSIDRKPLIEEGHVLDFDVHEIRTNMTNRYEKAVWGWREYVKEKQMIFFANSKSDAIGFQRFLRKQNIKSALILSDTPGWKRERATAAFRTGEVPILVSLRVLITGIDLPEACAGMIGCNSWMRGEDTINHHQATGRIARTYGEKEKGILLYLTTEQCHGIPAIQSSLGELPGKMVRKLPKKAKRKKKERKRAPTDQLRLL